MEFQKGDIFSFPERVRDQTVYRVFLILSVLEQDDCKGRLYLHVTTDTHPEEEAALAARLLRGIPHPLLRNSRATAPMKEWLVEVRKVLHRNLHRRWNSITLEKPDGLKYYPSAYQREEERLSRPALPEL